MLFFNRILYLWVYICFFCVNDVVELLLLRGKKQSDLKIALCLAMTRYDGELLMTDATC